jgi:hypothetical protein
LDHQCSLKGPWVKDVVLSLALLGNGGTFKRWAQWKASGHWRHAFEGNCGTLVPASLFLLLPGHEVNGFALLCALSIMCYLPQSNGPNQSWNQTSKPYEIK